MSARFHVTASVAALMLLSLLSPAAAKVAIRGTIRIYNPITERYDPAPFLRVRVVLAEYYDADTFDKETVTDAMGGYAVSKGSPWFRDGYDAQLRAVAESPGKLEVQHHYMQIDGYQAVSRVFWARDGRTTTTDLYIGGPRSSVDRYEVGGINGVFNFTASAVHGSNAFFIYAQTTNHRLHLTRLALSPGDFEEKEVSFPSQDWSTTGLYTAFLDYIHIPDIPNWNPDARGSYTCRHEASHGIMADVFPSVQVWAAFAAGKEHTMSQVTDPEFAWLEGWAEFLGSVTHALEYNKTETDLETLDSSWHKQVPANANGAKVEGEVAAALWDIFDPRGWETRLDQVADDVVPGVERFYDGIEDPELRGIWEVFRKEHPHSFAGVYATNLPLGGIGAFANFWLQRHAGQTHEFKAILYNRKMLPIGLTETRPEVTIAGPITWKGNVAVVPVQVRDADAEDRAFVRVSAFVNKGAAASLKMDKGWNGERNSATLEVPVAWFPGQPKPVLVVAAEDDMLTGHTRQVLVPPDGAAARALRVELGQCLFVVPFWAAAGGPNGYAKDVVLLISVAHGQTARQVLVPAQGTWVLDKQNYLPNSGGLFRMTPADATTELLRVEGLTGPIRFTYSLSGSVGGKRFTWTGNASLGATDNYGVGATEPVVHVVEPSADTAPPGVKLLATIEVTPVFSLQQAARPNRPPLMPAVLPGVSGGVIQAAPARPGTAIQAQLTPVVQLLSASAVAARVNALVDETARLQARALEAAEVLEWRLHPEKLARIAAADRPGGTPTPGKREAGQAEDRPAPSAALAPGPAAPGRVQLLGVKLPERGQVLQPARTPYLDAAAQGQGVVGTLPAKAREDLDEMRGELEDVERRLGGIPDEVRQLEHAVQRVLQTVRGSSQFSAQKRERYEAGLNEAAARLRAIPPAVPSYRAVLRQERALVGRAVSLAR